MIYINNGKPAHIIFIGNQPVIYDTPNHYTPPTNGIAYVSYPPPFYPNMIPPTVSYITKNRLNKFIHEQGLV